MNTVTTPYQLPDLQGTFNGPIFVIKRNGAKEKFHTYKIRRAISAACKATNMNVDNEMLDAIVEDVIKGIPAIMLDGKVQINDIQNLIENTLMGALPDVAKAYIIYRNKRDELRKNRVSPDMTAISDYTHPAKYAIHLPDKKRREVYSETVDRRKLMDMTDFGSVLENEIHWSYDFVYNKSLLPSMRSFQFGGKPIALENLRQYNCSYTFIDRPSVFGEIFYALLCGTGVGYSVQKHHVNKLPAISFFENSEKIVHHVVKDNITGWADAMNALIDGAIHGYWVEFAFHEIRDKGKLLKTSGGKAPGHVPLRNALNKIREILIEAEGRKLRPVEAHDITCHLAMAVLSGGIRRSSLIALFSFDDLEMMTAKIGKWWKKNPQRKMANNSVVMVRSEINEAQFDYILDLAAMNWGEPGFFLTDSTEVGANPCVEICLDPVLEITDETIPLIQEWVKENNEIMPNVKIGEKYTGFGLCNLCEINASNVESEQDFLNRCRAAAIIGTMQAARTKFPYLGWVTGAIAKRDALLGVSMTGILANGAKCMNPVWQQKGAEMINHTNVEIAHKLNIRTSARSTCVKPAGTTSLELGIAECGAHPAHSRRFIRRVTANPLEPVYQYFKEHNPHMCVTKPDGDACIMFPVEVSPTSIIKSDLSAIEHLQIVKSIHENWVVPGGKQRGNLTHSVSNTIVIKPEERKQVAKFLWENRNEFAAVSFLSEDGDKKYDFAPFEAVRTLSEEVFWNELIKGYKPVDYSKMVELQDNTNFQGEAACAGGACQL